jgi:hypothetical protein
VSFSCNLVTGGPDDPYRNARTACPFPSAINCASLPVSRI